MFWTNIPYFHALFAFCSHFDQQMSCGRVSRSWHCGNWIQDAPCGDFMTHFCCHPCANCQEHREIRERSVVIGSSVIDPPPFQTMGVPSSPTSRWFYLLHVTPSYLCINLISVYKCVFQEIFEIGSLPNLAEHWWPSPLCSSRLVFAPALSAVYIYEFNDEVSLNCPVQGWIKDGSFVWTTKTGDCRCVLIMGIIFVEQRHQIDSNWQTRIILWFDGEP